VAQVQSGASGAAAVQAHAWFNGIDWQRAARKQEMRVPWRPLINGPGDSTQYRRARAAAKHDVMPSSKALSEASPCRVPMHSPNPRTPGNVRTLDALFEDF